VRSSRRDKGVGLLPLLLLLLHGANSTADLAATKTADVYVACDTASFHLACPGFLHSVYTALCLSVTLSHSVWWCVCIHAHGCMRLTTHCVISVTGRHNIVYGCCVETDNAYEWHALVLPKSMDASIWHTQWYSCALVFSGALVLSFAGRALCCIHVRTSAAVTV
jgi:hypothetical protein